MRTGDQGPKVAAARRPPPEGSQATWGGPAWPVGTQRGFTYLWLLLIIAISAVSLVGLGQVWHTSEQREREAELIFRGNQYVRALSAYHAASGVGPAQWPSQLEDLVQDKRAAVPMHHLRRVYSDPSQPSAAPSLNTASLNAASPNTAWEVVRDAKNGIVGVRSRSTARAYIRRAEDEEVDPAASAASAVPVAAVPAASSASQAAPLQLRDHRFMAGTVSTPTAASAPAHGASGAMNSGPARPSWAGDAFSLTGASGPSWAQNNSSSNNSNNSSPNKPSSSLFP
jgi:type II secretory pathway pseudopilin PulG